MGLSRVVWESPILPVQLFAYRSQRARYVAYIAPQDLEPALLNCFIDLNASRNFSALSCFKKPSWTMQGPAWHDFNMLPPELFWRAASKDCIATRDCLDIRLKLSTGFSTVAQDLCFLLRLIMHEVWCYLKIICIQSSHVVAIWLSISDNSH